MRLNYKKLGNYIREADKRNVDGALGEKNLYGISVTKDFIISHANLVGVTFESYKVVEPRQFAYIPDTSRRGDKIAISLNSFGEKIIVSSICSVFEIIDENELLPEYLMLWFMRPEFDRYARFMSNGSAREVFDWDCMCGVDIPIPPIDEQRRTVFAYQVIMDRISLLRNINSKMVEMSMQLFNRLSSDETINWKEGKLKDIVYLTRNAIKSEDVGSLPYLPIDSIPSNELLIDTFRPSDEAQSSLITFDKDDILIGAMRVYFHRVAIAPCNGVTRTTCFVLKPYDADFLFYSLLLCNQNSTIDYANSTSQGTTMPYAVWENGLADMSIVYPDKNTLIEFNKTVKSLFDSIYVNTKEISSLIALAERIKQKGV